MLEERPSPQPGSRRAFLAEARRRLAACASHGSGHALLVFAPDRFHRVRDSLGHERASRLLRCLAERLPRLAPGVLCARIGVEEFALLFCAPGAAGELEQAWSGLQARLSLHASCVHSEVRLCFSAGVARFDAPEADLEQLVDAATASLHHAQASGGTACAAFDPGFVDEAREHVELELELRRALAARELRVHYQPIVSCSAGRVHGLEALARWRHPRRGWISPELFVPLAEESGLIHELGEYVLEEVLAQRARWRARGGELGRAQVSINVSGRQLDDERLVRALERAGARGELGGAPLWLELTESVQPRDGAAERARLLRLRQLGVRLALDDLGNGYSSLVRLRSLPFDALKLDRALTADIAADARSRQLFEALCGLARGLSLCIVPEGIESQAQLEVLSAAGCCVAQGYLWSPALPAADLEQWTVRRTRCSA